MTYITLTRQEDSWQGEIHTCAGWVARVFCHGFIGAYFAETRPEAYNHAYHALSRAKRIPRKPGTGGQ